MLTVAQISNRLEVTVFQVHKYIKKKQLKAEKIDGIYQVKEKDFEEFFNTYFINRHKNKGYRTPSLDAVYIMKEYADDILEDNMSIEDFMKKYKNIDSLIPPVKHFHHTKRNLLIIKDNKTMTQQDISKKYSLSVRAIEEIIRKSKEGSN